MAYSDTGIANMALARIGAKRLTSLDDDTTLEAIQCRTHYEQTRDALLRSHWWRFALMRAELTEDGDTPDFEWDHQYILPANYLRAVRLYDTTASYSLESKLLLTNDDSVDLQYIRRVTDPTEFGSLFVEVLVLQLAIKLVMPLSGDKVLRREIQEELQVALARARCVNLQETSTVGRDDKDLWIDARYEV